MYTYCFFCQTNKCDQIANLLKKEAFILDAISPKVVQRQRKTGINYEREFDLLPGYIFIYANMDISNSLTDIKRQSGIVRCLGNSENNFALEGEDYFFAINIYNKNGIINSITLQKNNDKLKVLDPMFVQMHAQVSRIDYKKGRANIEYEFAGRKCFTWVAVDVIDTLSA